VLRRLALLLVLQPAIAGAHELLHETRPGGAVAVRVYHPGGAPLADAAFEVAPPGGGPLLRGRTDRNGWLAFVPDAPGTWRVRVADGAGHGAEIPVEAGASASTPPPGGGPAWLLRPALGAAVVLLIFALLQRALRRRRA